VLNACAFPGNIRELENCVFRTATLAQGNVITDKDFSCRNDGCLSSVLWSGSLERSAAPATAAGMPIIAPPRDRQPPAPPSPPTSERPPADAAPDACPGAENCGVGERDSRSDRDRLIDAMERAGWVKAKAARLLGLTPRQIGYALQKHGVEVKKF
ncbi:MAG TPA: helix-turn-helix domain-containing protein, partial [Methylocystis sp.]